MTDLRKLNRYSNHTKTPRMPQPCQGPTELQETSAKEGIRETGRGRHGRDAGKSKPKGAVVQSHFLSLPQPTARGEGLCWLHLSTHQHIFVSMKCSYEIPSPDTEAKSNVLHKLARQGQGGTGMWLLQVTAPERAKRPPVPKAVAALGQRGIPQPTTAAGSPPGPSTCFCQGFPPPRRPLGFPVSTNQAGSGSEGTVAHTASNSHLRPAGGRHHVGTYLLTRALAAPTAPAPSGGLWPHRLSAGDGPSPPVPPSKAAGTVPKRPPEAAARGSGGRAADPAHRYSSGLRLGLR